MPAQRTLLTAPKTKLSARADIGARVLGDKHRQRQKISEGDPLVSVRVACRHCGLPVPDDSREQDFCCSGCAAVHGLLVEADLQRFYDLGGARGQAVGAVPAAGRYDWLPDLEGASTLGGAVVSLKLDVQGLRCAACIWLLQEMWRRQDGALDIRINPSVGMVRLTYDKSRLSVADFLNGAARLGYPMAPSSKRSSARDRGLLIRLGVCAALSMNAMLLALSGYLGLDAEGGELREIFRNLSAVFATLAVWVGMATSTRSPSSWP